MRGGVADPDDPSHIAFNLVTFPDDPRGAEQIVYPVDGYLKNDDSLSFQFRDKPRLGVSLGCDNISGVIPRDFVDGHVSLFH
jgi:hypothetical protein